MAGELRRYLLNELPREIGAAPFTPAAGPLAGHVLAPNPDTGAGEMPDAPPDPDPGYSLSFDVTYVTRPDGTTAARERYIADFPGAK